MKRNELAEAKKSEIKDLIKRVSQIEAELMQLQIDKNAAKLSNLRQIFNRRKDLAQIKTVLRLKQLLTELNRKDEKEEVLNG